MEESLPTSPRLARSPGNSTRVHSIEAILGFKDGNMFHPTYVYNGSPRVAPDAHRGHTPSPLRKEHNSETLQSKWALGLLENLDMYLVYSTTVHFIISWRIASH